MYTYSMSFNVTNANASYLHKHMIVHCKKFSSFPTETQKRDDTPVGDISVAVCLILVLGGCFDSASVL